MKQTDDYNGKRRLWALSPDVRRIPRIANLPQFGHRKFSSYEELNAWKKELVTELVRNGGAKWTS